MSLRNTIWHIHADDDWRRLAPADPELILAVEPSDQFHAKQGRSIARWPLGDGELVVYLKRHYRESRLRGWLATLTGRPGWSAAWQEFEHLHWAATNGFAVPRAVAAGEGVGPAGLLRGYLAVEELTGMLPLHELIPRAARMLSPKVFHAWKRGLVTELARVVRSLHDKRRFHKDLYLCHFYVPELSIHAPPADWTNWVAMIDLHRLAQHRLTWRWWQLKDLAQLLYSTDLAGLTARDRLRFWRLYAGPNRRRGLGPWLRRLIQVRWQNYRGHNAARRAA